MQQTFQVESQQQGAAAAERAGLDPDAAGEMNGRPTDPERPPEEEMPAWERAAI